MRETNYKIPTAVLAICACFMWSTAFAAIKIGQQEYFQPFSFAGIRFMLSGLLLLPFWGGLAKNIQPITANWRKILVLAIVNTFLHYGLFYTSIFQLPGALVAIIVGSSPLITATIAHFFVRGEHISGRKLTAILFGISGIIRLSLDRSFSSNMGSMDLVYILMLIGAVTCAVIGSVIVAKQPEAKPISPIVLTSTQIFLGGSMLFIVSLFAEGTPQILNKSWKFYSALLWLSFISAAAFSIWFVILKRPNVSVTDINQWKFIIPFFGAILSWLFVSGESPTTNSITGMSLILASVLFYEFIKQKELTKLDT